MGNECVACTPSQKYKRYFTAINISGLKDLWPSVKVYNIKKIFDRSAIKNPQNNNEIEIPFQNFKTIFNQFQSYPEQQVKRLFEFFDMENQGYVDWNSFFSTITVCYFCEQNTLALIMFMMYDLSLDFKLDKDYLELLIQNNERFFKAGENGIQPCCEDVLEEMQSGDGLSLQKWMKTAEDYFQLSKFRTVFNLFQQQKLEKELVRHFHQWNSVFIEEQQKFVGYLINIKWFQSWALYIQHHYNVKIDIYRHSSDPLGTIKTLTSYTFKTARKIEHQSKIGTTKSINGFREMENPKGKSASSKSHVKNFDFVHGNLGEKPREISNSQIQGEYEDILKSEIAENIDYVIVAERVWKYLQDIYGGCPQFRRTGFDGIELYPKIIRIYLSLFKGSIDYSSEICREASAYYQLQQLLVKSCDFKSEDVQKYAIFFKTVKMKKWEEVDDPSLLFAQMTTEDLIFLVCIPKEEKEQFIKKHQKAQINITEVNLGDTLLLKDQSLAKKAIFMGKTVEGKYILHLQGKHYTEDICLLQSQLQKRCSILQDCIEKQNEKQGYFKQLIGLPAGAGLGFINSTFLQLFNMKQFHKFLTIFNPANCEQKLLYRLSFLYKLLKKKGRIQSGFIKQSIQIFLNKYSQFEVSMCANFIEQLLDELSNEMGQEEMLDLFTTNFNIEIEKHVSCVACKREFLMKSSNFVYRAHLPEEDYSYFQVFWVPNQGKDILKYLVKIRRLATLGDFMSQIEKQLNIQSQSYILAEVYANDIAKNFNSVPKSTTLVSLKVRQNNKFFAYELKSSFSSFVSKFYNNSQSVVGSDCIKKDKFLDCNHPQTGWIFGKIVQIQLLPITHIEIVKVMHKFNKNENWQVSYQVIDGEVARYPLKSHKNCDQYHLRLNQRCYSQTSNSMQLVNIPLVVALPSWMRWKEFSFQVYQQVRRFIADQYSFNSESEENIIPTGRQIKKATQLSTAQKFKDYCNSSKFPYILNLCDFQGRCVVCYKFVKSVVFKGENQHYCQGCKLSNNDPISWQAKPADLIVCVDWKAHECYKKDISVESPLFKEQSMYRYKQSYQLQEVLSGLNNKYVQNEQFLCCSIKDKKIVTDKILQSSSAFVIYIQRVVQEEDGFKKIMKRSVKYIQQGLKVGNKSYDLVGVTAIEGENMNIRYKTFTRKSKKEWYWFDNQIVKIVDSSHIQKQCVLALYYEESQL